MYGEFNGAPAVGTFEQRTDGTSACHINFVRDEIMTVMPSRFAFASLRETLRTRVSFVTVAVTGLLRLLLRAIGEEHVVPKETWDALKQFGVTKQVLKLLGCKATALDRGRADQGAMLPHER